MKLENEGIFSESINELKILLYSFFVYIKIEAEPILILTVLMLLDTLFGIVKTFKIDNTQFKFKKLITGFLSKIVMLALPMVVALIGKGLGYELTIFVGITIKLFIVSEGISIFSNAISIKTGKEVEDFDIITQALKAIREKLIKLASFFFSQLKDEDIKKDKNK